MSRAPAAAEVAALYEGLLPPFDAWFVRARAAILPFAEFERPLPKSGTVVELGCGHGLVANYLALCRPERQVLGVDLSAPRIELAARTVRGRGNISFVRADIRELDIPPCEAIVVIGVFCLIPFEAWDGILAACRARLKRGGLLLIQEIEREQRLLYALCAAKERLMAWTGITLAEGLFVKPAAELEAQLRGHGFRVGSRRVSIPLHPSRIYEAVVAD